MINIKDYQNLKLTDVANFERAKEGVVYSKGVTLIQLSATKGDVEYQKENGEVDRKYAVVFPNEDINPKYLNIVIKRNIQHFLSKYQAGLNIQIRDIEHMPIQLHNKATQDMIAEHVETIEREEESVKKQIEIFTTTKNRFLRDMLL